MKILWTFCVYNEIELLPYKIDYMKKNNIDFYIFDNMSKDGTWEYLQDNKIPSEQFDSDGMFDLALNMKLLHNKIHEVKPDWCILSGTDIFYVHKDHKNLRATIEAIDAAGYNAVNSGFNAFNFYHTGSEEPGKDPRVTYKFYKQGVVKDTCIAKYNKGLSIAGDHFKLPKLSLYRSKDLVFLHYVFRHDAKERKMEQYTRRKKAWDTGKNPKGWGRHYAKQATGQCNVQAQETDKDIKNIKDSEFNKKIKTSIKNG